MPKTKLPCAVVMSTMPLVSERTPTLHPSAAPLGKAQLPAHPRPLRRRATATAHLDSTFIRTPRGRRKDVNVRLPVHGAAP